MGFIPLIAAYVFGGLLCFLFLFVQLFLRKRLRAWILPFVLGIVVFVLGVLLVIFSQAARRGFASPLEIAANLSIEASLLFFYASTAIFCCFVYYKKHFDTLPVAGTRIEMPLPSDEQKR